ncbi:MAG: MarR family transcriptional regulator [Chloroflexi bacterium]|nr:MAG: MarR family transcriptional regulator [Chloroflexota bacterium]RLC82751.1 MAG: MarR family transcriptional regulator [Chloroflexota bacterium]HEY73592.1 MarR family transcriptional regulator [Thermoflexia bacterium]
MTEQPLQENTGHLLMQTCKLLRIRVHTLLGEIGLYCGQPFVLRVLWQKEGVTHSELAGRLHIQPATITNTLKRMEKAGFVERRQDEQDQRVSRVYLTDAGRNVREGVEKAWDELEERAFAGLDSDEIAMFRQLLVHIHGNLMKKDKE